MIQLTALKLTFIIVGSIATGVALGWAILIYLTLKDNRPYDY